MEYHGSFQISTQVYSLFDQSEAGRKDFFGGGKYRFIL